MQKRSLLNWFTDLYPVWLIAFAAVGLAWPATLVWFRDQWVVWSLSVVMLGMGLTLRPDDFRRLLQMPGALALGFLAHYTIMPLLGWAIARGLSLEPGFAVGLILVACCPSGTASNVISYLARGNLALAVLVTLTSTLLAFVMTPLWCKTLAGQYVPVNAGKLCLSTLQIAVAPVLMGVLCNWRFPRATARIAKAGPVVSVLALMFITGGIAALNAEAVLANAGRLAAAAVLLHTLGFGVGYLVARVLGYRDDVARTVSIEVGMQNAGLAMVLARQNFAAQPLAAVPATFSAVVQNLTGSILAGYWRARPPADGHPRSRIYYWKCDRPAAFHGTAADFARDDSEGPLRAALAESLFGAEPFDMQPGRGQGNHITWEASAGEKRFFIRIDDGPERDDYLEVESRILDEVRTAGVPAPRVFHCDAGRQRTPFAWHALELVPAVDLNQLHKQGTLDLNYVAGAVGEAMARWQGVAVERFGPFCPATLRRTGRLVGFHRHYADYFNLNLSRHLHFLTERGFLPSSEADALRREMTRHEGLLALERGCLVHKDLALWNVLGTSREIAAVIDWDDAIAGDPSDDLSLLGCFHDGKVLQSVMAGYGSLRPLPADFRRRFWLHLMRNMIVKAVIRVGAGYFERSEQFFLIGAGSTGPELRKQTHARLAAALAGLRADAPIESLEPLS